MNEQPIRRVIPFVVQALASLELYIGCLLLGPDHPWSNILLEDIPLPYGFEMQLNLHRVVDRDLVREAMFSPTVHDGYRGWTIIGFLGEHPGPPARPPLSQDQVNRQLILLRDHATNYAMRANAGLLGSDHDIDSKTRPLRQSTGPKGQFIYHANQDT